MKLFLLPSHSIKRWMPLCRLFALFSAGRWICTAAAEPATPDETWAAAAPLLQGHCYDCHGNGKSKGGVDLQRLEKEPAFAAEFELWTKVQFSLRSGEMPPDDARKPLPDAARERLGKALGASLQGVITANAGDPGPVTLRRLSNAEYDNTIRDLTGIDFQLGKEFTPDAGGGEGFSNLGDVLFLNPQQLNSYFTAARKLTDHAMVTPGSGIRFSTLRIGPRDPSQLRAGTEAVLYRWYQEKSLPHLPTDDEDLREADYMLACWQWKHRTSTGATSLEALAKQHGLKIAFLENWWAALESDKPISRFLDLTRLPWRALPAPDATQPGAVPAEVTRILHEIQSQRRAWLQPKQWPVQRAQQDADGLRPYPVETVLAGQESVFLVVGDTGDGNKGDRVFFEGLEVQRDGKFAGYLEWLESRKQEDTAALAGSDPDLAAKGLTRAALQQRLEQAEAVFARTGKEGGGRPVDRKSLLLEAPVVLTLPMPKDAQRFRAKGRLDLEHPDAAFATAQWLATTNAPPDPAKIIPGVLTVWKRQTEAQRNTMEDFNRMKSVFPDILERRLEEVARNFHRGGTGPGVYFLNDHQLRPLLSPEDNERMGRLLEDWRFVRVPNPQSKLLQEWDETLLKHLEGFAARAWRRPLSQPEQANLAQIYQRGIAAELDRESAAREVLVRVLVAPDFLFKLEQNQGAPVHPVTPWELASRLSYLLWSSLPDATLSAEAASGALLKVEGLKAAAKRMLRDERATALAREFAAQWLEFHHFDAHAKVDAGKFPEFTPELRADLHREAVAFFDHIVRNDRPVREILQANYTFLNERLAKHYRVEGVTGDALVQTDVSRHGRGGILGMGALLTKTSYPHRTSPVLRGNWLLQAVLGTRTPPPPNDVPKLDESVASAQSVRERLERHRADKACAACHDKIDPLGFALEAFDPIGRLRAKDEAGILVDTSAKTRDGRTFQGADGLRAYLASREEEFLGVFCRKLLGYALGRTVLPTDQPLLDTMKRRLQKEDGTFSTAVLAVVESKQFTHRRND